MNVKNTCAFVDLYQRLNASSLETRHWLGLSWRRLIRISHCSISHCQHPLTVWKGSNFTTCSPNLIRKYFWAYWVLTFSLKTDFFVKLNPGWRFSKTQSSRWPVEVEVCFLIFFVRPGKWGSISYNDRCGPNSVGSKFATGTFYIYKQMYSYSFGGGTEASEFAT